MSGYEADWQRHNYRCREKLSVMQGFFLGGEDWVAKILPIPQPTAVPQWTANPTFWPEPVPPTEFCPRKFQKFYFIFLPILTTF